MVLQFGDVFRRADAGDNIFALRIDQKFAVENSFTGRRISGKGNARTRLIACISEDHRLHVDGSSPL